MEDQLRLDVVAPVIGHIESKSIDDFIEGGAVSRRRFPVRFELTPFDPQQTALGVQASTAIAKVGGQIEATITMSWTNRPSVSVTPANVSFGTLQQPGEVASKKLLIRSNDHQAFRVLGIDSGPNSVVLIQSGPNYAVPAQSHTIELAYTRNSHDQRFVSGQTLIRTDHPDMPQLSMRWSAICP